MSDLLKKINLDKLPRHIAIIMDGNGRWAKKRGFLRTVGHQKGIKSIRSVVEACGQIGVKYLTLYAFSSENWKRPKREVDMLMILLVRTLERESKSFMKEGIRLNIIGEEKNLPQNVQKALDQVKTLTKNNKKAFLTLALSYGGQDEIVRAATRIAEELKNKNHQLTKEILEANLYTHDLPAVDLLIRTGGEQRVSNFLLWQIAYAELYFTQVLWPDFQKENLYEAVLNYQQRERRYGRLCE